MLNCWLRAASGSGGLGFRDSIGEGSLRMGSILVPIYSETIQDWLNRFDTGFDDAV